MVGKAGDQALRRSAFQEAISHLGKAIALADKADVSDRQQKLHVTYGNALIAARGYGAPETTEAFARARQSAACETDAPERFSVDYGLWVGSYLRGELAPNERTRPPSSATSSKVPMRPKPASRIARQNHALVRWRLRRREDHLEQALALFRPGRDDDLAFRFGHDPGVGAMLYLAIAAWPMGDVSLALSLAERATARIASVTHIGTKAYGAMHTAMFELMRGDIARVASNTTSSRGSPMTMSSPCGARSECFFRAG